ncbi:hypothetical protein DAPPUDRAFT_257341 [Daphnia pulex]|uniref:Uncharacterized protein n=1 Tax=Daphnia pulex TaxID=6669 RepID=E9HDD6_DAPPU|nr:hypothetical protein DAPPUDRAFT_257341 [Daphnia pulex]|eukprot:EFX70232.1 hypothetical protein DAPPUDRAFT_257341 [Daphnia pulex]
MGSATAANLVCKSSESSSLHEQQHVGSAEQRIFKVCTTAARWVCKAANLKSGGSLEAPARSQLVKEVN